MKKILLLLAMILLAYGCKKSSSSTTKSKPLPTNYISATVNGKTISGTAGFIPYGIVLNYSDSSDTIELVFNMGVWNLTGTIESAAIGDYTLSNFAYTSTGLLETSNARCIIKSKSLNDSYGTNSIYTGSISITTGGYIITGTFGFTGVDTSGNTVNVTNGILNQVNLN